MLSPCSHIVNLGGIFVTNQLLQKKEKKNTVYCNLISIDGLLLNIAEVRLDIILSCFCRFFYVYNVKMLLFY